MDTYVDENHQLYIGPMSSLFTFPDPVNEKAARTVAAVVTVAAAVVLATGWLWLLVPLAYGFIARALTGPTLSPLGALAMKVVGPRLGRPKPTAGPPKRFAQSIGAVLTTAAAIAGLALGWTTVALTLTAILGIFALLESAVGFCAGCFMYAQLMRLGVIKEEACPECADIWLHRRAIENQAATTH